MMWGRSEQRLDDELRFDYEQRVENHRRAGMSEAEARRTARLEFGGLEQIKEECRDQQRFRLLRELLQDVHYGLRMMRRSPGFTAVALLTLALGIGANTAIFTLMDAVLMKSLPVRDPGGLVLLGHAHGEGDGSVPSGSYDLYSLDLYQHLASTKTLNELCALQSTDSWISVFRQGWSVALPVSGKFVSGNYFQVLGVAAARGRTIAPQDDAADAPPAAVISYRLWEQKFNKDPRIIGSTVDLDRIPVSIVGVAPPEFTGETPEPDPPSVWMPISALRQLSPDHELLDAPDTHWLYLMGRLNPGVSIAQGQARLTAALQNWLTSREGTTVSPARQKEIAESYIELTPGGSGVPHMQHDYGQMLTLLLGISSLVLLITCANIATLLMARGAARDAERSVRLALGASPARLLRQWLTEGLMLGLAGGTLGLLVAFGATRALIALVFGRIYIPLQTAPDFRVLFFALALSCGTGVVFGLIPALRQRNGLAQSIRRGSAGVRGITFSRRRFSASGALIASQVALSLAVLVCAGLLVRSLRNVNGQRFGFTPQHVLIVRIDPSLGHYEYSSLSPLYRQMYARLNALPGVKSASLSYYSPFYRCCWISSIAVEGHTPDPRNDHSLLNRVSAGYFETVGTGILHGRSFDEHDNPTSRRVAVVNEEFVRQFLPNTNPIGGHFGVGGNPSRQSDLEIVGVVENAKYDDPREKTQAMAFLPLSQVKPVEVAERRNNLANVIEVRSIGDPMAIAGEVRQVMTEIAPELPLLQITTLADDVRDMTKTDIVIADLAGFFGGLALLLTCIGLYGLTAWTVQRRTSEIGIRAALGANRGTVIAMVMREALAQSVPGILIGVPATLAATKLIASQLYGVSPFDPRNILVAVLVLLLCIAVAGYLPARRASRIDPAVALRYE